MQVRFRVYPSDCPGCAGTGDHRRDDHLRLLGKIVMRPESAEERAALDVFRVHVRSPQSGNRFEMTFKPRPEPEPNGPMPPAVQIAGMTDTGDEVGPPRKASHTETLHKRLADQEERIRLLEQRHEDT